MKITADTNILVSGTFWSGDSFKILRLADEGKIELILSKELLKEYYKIIESDEITEKAVNKSLIISEIADKSISNAKIVIPQKKLNVVKSDPDDNKIVECALEGKVDYIVTNDKHLLELKEFEGIKIVKPADFLKIL